MIEKFDEDGEIDDYVPNDVAENREYMRQDYYPNLIRGKTKAGLTYTL